jgi:hypothetical protein
MLPYQEFYRDVVAGWLRAASRTRLFGLARKYQLPVTLFIYPSAISNTDYAMTWKQLAELKNSGLFEVQSHTLWHANFLQEKRRLSSTEYDKFASTQLAQSKKV